MIGSPRGGEEDAGLGDLVGDLVAGAGAAVGVAACSSFSLAMMTEAFLGVRECLLYRMRLCLGKNWIEE